MEICRRNDVIEISDVDPFLAELLRQIPASANPADSPAAQQRLFSAPADANEKETCREWKIYVEPELRRLFQNSIEVIADDLKQLNGKEKSVRNCTLRVPIPHVDAWLNGLNQARLAIAARCNFTDGELGDHYRSPIGSRRDLSLFQVNFYVFLQEFILREMNEPGK